MGQNRKNYLYAACLIVYATIMTSIVWMLHLMNVEFALGFSAGVALTIGCVALISREFRNLS